MTLFGRLAFAATALVVLSGAAPAYAGGEQAPTAAPDDEAGWDIPGEIAVDFADDLPEPEITALFRVLSAPFFPTSLAEETRTYVVRADPTRFSELSARLAAEPRVELIEPHARVRAAFVPDDPLLGEQWH